MQNKNQWIAAGVGVVVGLAVLMSGTSIIDFSDESINTGEMQDQTNLQVGDQSAQETTKQPEVKKETTKTMPKEITTKEGLKYTDVVVGTGAVAVAGKDVIVHYTGTFTNGNKFDSSVDRGEPFTFFLGSGQVIKGWDLGVAGMKVGGKRQLTVPASLGYGPNDYGPIPGNSTLLFDVELLGVK
jgi:FKBP-type peptidyl-prolyl cis-trans isomerase